MYGVHLTDINTCYKVFKKEALRGIKIVSDNFTFETEITAKFIRKGYSILEVPIDYAARSNAQGKKMRWGRALEMYWGMIKYRNDENFENPKIPKKKSQELILFSAVLIWISFWYRYDFNNLKNNIPYYKTAVKSSLDQLRAMHCIYDSASRNYYPIIQFCDRIIPPDDKLSLILPTLPTRRYEYLREKGRYYLYPRNYGNNSEAANYILIYGVEDLKIPETYQKAWVFAQDKYLIAKRGSHLMKLN